MNQTNGLQARAFIADYREHINVRLMETGENGRRFLVKPIEFTEAEPGMYYPESFRLSLVAAQLLMDDLWAAGVRPTEGQGSAGQIGAVQAHLADMRKLVSKQLEVDL